MRSLQLAVLLFAASASALSVTEAGTTFTLADPAQASSPYGSGEVWLACSACSEPLNTLKGSILGVNFVHQNAPGVRALTANGRFLGRELRWSYEISSRFPAGARLYPVVNDAMCICGNVAETSPVIDVPRPDQAFTTDPEMTGLFVLVSSPDRQKATAGKTDRLVATCDASPQQGEQGVIEVRGPGVALRHVFTSHSEGRLEADITPTAAGTLEAWCTFMPYGNTSKVKTAEVVAPKAPGGGSSGGSEHIAEPEPEGGCSATGAPALVALAALALSVFSSQRKRGCFGGRWA